jgi:hypothetical protein
LSRIALVTCSTVPRWEVDDRPLVEALRARGAAVEEPHWHDASVDWRAFDAALIRTTWDYVPRADAFVAWAERAARATRLFNPPEVVRWNVDKRYLRELACRGVPVAPTRWIEPGARPDLRAELALLGASRGFLKPVIGASAVGSFRFDADDEGLAAAAAHLAATPAAAGFMLQPYLRRVEREGEVSLVFVDGALSHAVRKTPPPGDYRVQDDYGAKDAPHVPAADESEVARRALAAAPGSKPLLYARVDLLRDDDGRPVLVELELIEPSLFFRHDVDAPPPLADALLRPNCS